MFVHLRARSRLRALGFLFAVVITACGGGSTDTSPAASTSSAGDFPQRIVSLSPTATEMLFAIGAGDQVIAADENSNYPAEAPTTKLSGFEPSIEAIANYEPDLVVISSAGPVVKALKKLKIETLVQPAAATLEDSYEQIEELGVVTGHAEEANKVVESMRADIEDIVASVPIFEEAPTYYHELDDGFFTVTSETFIGQVYSLLGLRNIADRAPDAESGYPQLSVEYIVDADPDLIFLADTKCCDQSKETVSKRPGWQSIAAVERGAIVELDDDVASRWGPRVVDFLRAVVDEVTRLEPE